MNKYIVTLDLGTTNIKIGLYNFELREISIVSEKVKYLETEGYIEFDPEYYWKLCKEGIRRVIYSSKINPKDIITLSLTGQAETLVVLDSENNTIRNAISWMDNRSRHECKLLKKYFKDNESYKITGLPEIIPTWPITKILWIKNNETEVFQKAGKYLLLKDYIIFKLTNKFLCDHSIASFTHYFNINEKKYWDEILDFVGIDIQQLPELVDPCSTVGVVKGEIVKEFDLLSEVTVNIGILDHFAGMLGVGNIKSGILSETTGTVLALATMLKKPEDSFFPIPKHCGPFNSYILLPVCESGGICLEWFKDNFYQNTSFSKINSEVEKNFNFGKNGNPIFLPYIIGSNSPEFNQDAKGVFYGLKIHHKKIDLAISIFESLAYLLRKNIEHLGGKGISLDRVISLGGGINSNIWNQIKANVIQREIYLPKYKEATSFGAAIIGVLEHKKIDEIDRFIDNYLEFSIIIPDTKYRKHYDDEFYKFTELYYRLEDFFQIA